MSQIQSGRNKHRDNQKCKRCRDDRKKCESVLGQDDCQRCSANSYFCGVKDVSNRIKNKKVKSPNSRRPSPSSGSGHNDMLQSIPQTPSSTMDGHNLSLSDTNTSHQGWITPPSNYPVFQNAIADTPATTFSPDVYLNPFRELPDIPTVNTWDEQYPAGLNADLDSPKPFSSNGSSPSLPLDHVDPQILISTPPEDNQPQHRVSHSNGGIADDFFPAGSITQDELLRLFQMIDDAQSKAGSIDTQINEEDVTKPPVLMFFTSVSSMSPSNIIINDRIIAQIHLRLKYIWGNQGAFATKGVSLRTGKTISKYFSVTAPELALISPMVREAYYACGAADALGNTKLKPYIRQEYEAAYIRHNTEAERLINKDIKDHNEGRLPDVSLLYHAIFLHCASSACVKGPRYINKAKAAFHYLDGLVKDRFPFKIVTPEFVPDVTDEVRKENWNVRMTLTEYPEDSGMELNRSSFPLGWARFLYDQERGVCVE